MRYIGPVQTGIQETTKDELELRAAGKTILTASTLGFQSGYVTSNPSEISTTTEIPANNNVVMAGPITVTSTGTLTVSGSLIII